MMPGMVLRDEDSDPLDPAHGICWGLFFSAIFWGFVGLAIIGWCRP